MLPQRIKPGQEITAGFLNFCRDGVAAAGTLQKGVHGDGRHSAKIGKWAKCDFAVFATEDIPAFSVFTIKESLTYLYDAYTPVLRVEKIISGAKTKLYTNGTGEIAADDSFYPYELGEKRAHELKVDTTNPIVKGDTAGRKDNEWTVEKGGSELLCITDPDAEDIAWFIGIPSASGVKRVRVKDEILCTDPTGTATVLKDKVDGLPCEVEETTEILDICNIGNRPIKCQTTIPHEDGFAYQVSGFEKWLFIPDRRSEKAYVTVSEAVCDTTPTLVEPGSENFLDVCDWEETIETVANPFNRHAAAGDVVEVTWDVTCGWRISDVPRVDINVVSSFSGCSGGCTSLDAVYYPNVGVETCNPSPASSPILQLQTTEFLTGTYFDVESDGLGGTRCITMGTFGQACVVNCGALGTSTRKLNEFKSIKPMTGLALGDIALACTVQEISVPCIGAQEVTDCVPLEDCQDPADPVNDV